LTLGFGQSPELAAPPKIRDLKLTDALLPLIQGCGSHFGTFLGVHAHTR